MSDSASSWVQALGSQSLPVLGQNLNQCRELLESSSAALSDIGQIINNDPGLASLIFRHINQGRVANNRPLISTIESSLNLLGVEAIRQLLNQVTVLEDQIQDPKTRNGWYRLIIRSYHAARLAQEWASQQSDRAPSEIFIATFLMNVGEYCIATVDPNKYNLLLDRQSRQLKQVAEQEVLDGILSRDISTELARQWGLPELLQDTLDPALILSHRVQLCSIPSSLAYEADINGWGTDAMLTCYGLASDILRQSSAKTTAYIHELSTAIAREMSLPGVRHAAARLVELPGDMHDESQAQEGRTNAEQLSAFKLLSKKLTQAIKEGLGANDLIKLGLQSLREDFGFDRCLLLLPDAEKKRLTIRAAPGFSRSPLLKRALPRIDKPGLFTSAMSKPQALRIYDDNYPRVAASIPEDFSALIQSANFMLFSFAIGDKPIAMIYSDMSGHPIGAEQVQEAKGIAALLSRAITHAVRPA